MKHDAIVGQGIPIHERVEIPPEMVPEDSKVEIDAKIHAGYCELSSSHPHNALLTSIQVTTGVIPTMADLSKVQGRAWEDVDVSFRSHYKCKSIF